MAVPCACIALVLVATLMAGGALACRCVEYTPKRGACKSDFVIVAEVTEVNSSNNIESYDLAIKSTFKSNAAFRSLVASHPQSASLSTHKLSSCRIYLNKGKTYLITGHVNEGRLTVIACNFNAEWSSLSPEQQQGFQGAYYTTC